MKKGPSFCKSNLCVAKPEMLVMMLYDDDDEYGLFVAKQDDGLIVNWHW